MSSDARRASNARVSRPSVSRAPRWPAVIAALAAGCTPSTPAPANPSAPATSAAALPAPTTADDAITRALPDSDRWLAHARDELLPFWTHADALGEPPGNYPTFRCNDGTAYRADAPCAELRELPAWIAGELGTEYTRMKSRQAFAYGVGFHLTGDPALLARAANGVAWLRAHAYEHDTGSAISRWRDGMAGPPVGQRTSQDLAYAQAGLAFYYYLTRDPAVLDDLRRLRDHVLGSYWEPAWGMLRWVREDGDEAGASSRRELVAQLDQINAYLLLVARAVPAAEREAWHAPLRRLARVIREQYFAGEHGLFWGVLGDPEQTVLGGRHTDFGHTIKALWMLYLTGQLVGDDAMVAFAREHIPAVLERAAQPSGCWASGLRRDGDQVRLARDSQWWIAAELDQAAATLALREPDRDRYARYLGPSYRCWLERFVDHDRGEVWPFVPAEWSEDVFRDRQPLKQFHWKNGYHSLEHALVAAITTAGMTGQSIALHFALHPDAESGAALQPYLFTGEVASRRALALPGAEKLRGVRVEFADVR